MTTEQSKRLLAEHHPEAWSTPSAGWFSARHPMTNAAQGHEIGRYVQPSLPGWDKVVGDEAVTTAALHASRYASRSHCDAPRTVLPSHRPSSAPLLSALSGTYSSA